MAANGDRIGIALGAGAARGCAHIGVLDAVRDVGIEIHAVAGTSIGSLVGGVYASGKIEQLRCTLLEMDWQEILYTFFEISIPRSGLIDGKRIVEFIAQYTEDCNIQDLSIPFQAVSTDIMTGEEVILRDGPLIKAIRASIAMPGVFTPVTRGSRVLVDGGLVNPVPVSVVRAMGADRIIAVDINANRVGAQRRRNWTGDSPHASDKTEPLESSRSSEESKNRLVSAWKSRIEEIDGKVKTKLHRWTRSDSGPNIFDVIGNTIRIMEAQIGEGILAATRPEVVIRPRVGDVSFLEFNRGEEMIEEGYRAAQEAIATAREEGRL